MLTLDSLQTIVQKHLQAQKKMTFCADHYTVHIDFKSTHTASNFYAKIYIVLENLATYTKTDKIRSLQNYVKRNTQALAYMHSSLAYSKNHEVIVQYFLFNKTHIDRIMLVINFLLQHADILTQSEY